MTSVLLQIIRDAGGEAAVAELLARAKIKHEIAYLGNAENWVSLDDACAMLEAGVQQTGDPSFARRVGEHTLRQHAGTQVATVLRSLGSTEAVLHAVAQTATRLSTVTKMETVGAAQDAVDHRSARRGRVRHRARRRLRGRGPGGRRSHQGGTHRAVSAGRGGNRGWRERWRGTLA